MRSRVAVLTGVLLAAALSSARAHGWQASPEDHAKHHPGAQAAEQAAPVPQATSMAGMNMMAPNPKLDELVKKMNAAQGQAKVDAMAELLTAMVQEHQSMHANMSGMMSMMHKMGAAGGHEDAKK